MRDSTRPVSSLMRLLFVGLLVVQQLTTAANTKEDDLITSLPGLKFQYNAKQYSGMLSASGGASLHYWLLESTYSPSSDPLLVWLNGGPGASSLIGLFTEIGPFWPEPSGKTLFENVYAWNKFANVLFLESPRNVGFSTGPQSTYSDDNTMKENAQAIRSFLNRFPEYKHRDFYLTGESYFGVYGPMLTAYILNEQRKNANSFPINFRGLAIGNGMFSEMHQTNSLVHLAMYRGILDYSDHVFLMDMCCPDNPSYIDCNFYQYITLDQYDNVKIINNPDPDIQRCGQIVYDMVETLLKTPGYTGTSHSQSCYAAASKWNQSERAPRNELLAALSQELVYTLGEQPIISDGQQHFIDAGSSRNGYSSDALGGFPCYADVALETYLNQPDVRRAIHINGRKKWTSSAPDVSKRYTRDNHEMHPFFDWIVSNLTDLHRSDFRMLIYNGDADSVCQFVSNEWFVEDLADRLDLEQTKKRQQWFYQKADEFLESHVGFSSRYESDWLEIDLVTLSGASHLVPQSRPPVAFQMIRNFVQSQRDYSTPVHTDSRISFAPADILPRYQEVLDETISRRDVDRVTELPGLTFELPPYFEQYSGYLYASKGNYLHYWLIGSSFNDRSDPLILWLNGGPGCSSLGGALTELGLFRNNPDGTTLSENPWSWNKVANLLFLEGPRRVGFSWQNRTESRNDEFNDQLTAEDNYLAIKDFFNVHPKFQNRDFYITGESYGIKSGDLKNVRLVGMAVGNGELSPIEQIKSNTGLLYNRGLIDKNQWDRLAECCGDNYSQADFCDIMRFVKLDEFGNAQPITPGDYCDEEYAAVAQAGFKFGASFDTYNINQDCYVQQAVVFGSRNVRERRRRLGMFTKQQPQSAPVMGNFEQLSTNTVHNTFSTDPNGGFPCYSSAAATKWLNSKDVRRALHVPSYVQDWQFCSDEINEQYYHQQFNDTGSVFDDIINSGHPLSILIYNGDLDLACNLIGDQWFIEKTAKRNHLHVSRPHSPWMTTGSNVAGYAKQFKNRNGDVTIDLLTVKHAGHLVPTDTPAQALQMIYNFLKDEKQYNSTYFPFKMDPAPLNEQYKQEEKYAGQIGARSPLDVPSEAAAASVGRPQRIFTAIGNPDRPAVDVLDREDNEPINIPPPDPNAMREENEVQTLPGLPDFRRGEAYSGYLTVDTGIYLHYWYAPNVRHERDSPLLLWLNGGPGCSSLAAVFGELGPYRPRPRGQHLERNQFTWSKFANVLYLESPRGVGFSYSDNRADPPTMKEPYDDDLTARYNYKALVEFVRRFAGEYGGIDGRQHDFYVTGESYGGVYVPTLMQLVIGGVELGQLPGLRVRGLAIGNGILSSRLQVASAIPLLYYRGVYDLDTYRDILACCGKTRRDDLGVQQPCDLNNYFSIDDQGNAIRNPDTKNETCTQLVLRYGFNEVWSPKTNVYNTFLDCYDEDKYIDRGDHLLYRQSKRILENKYTFVDQAKLYDRWSSDSVGGFTCYQQQATQAYLRRRDVLDAIGIDRRFPKQWTSCNQDINDNYKQQYHDMTDTFKNIIQRSQALIEQSSNSMDQFKMLIYNGDADMACEFMGDEWFTYSLANEANFYGRNQRSAWEYATPFNDTANYFPRLAGFSKTFARGAQRLDLLTIKGAGHFSPADRAAPTLQAIRNFVEADARSDAETDYSRTLPLSYFMPTPSDSPRLPSRDEPTRRQLAQVFDLPGLTFKPSFDTYSGYLKGAVDGDYLHYWYVEAREDPKTAPWALWLTGGPGCSSLGGMIGENGPFFVNPDGQTLFENIYSWNKAVNILYLESPREVGFSYRDKNVDHNGRIGDAETAESVVAALADFLGVFTELRDRDFYITGESYGGVYIPTTTVRLMDELARPNQGIFEGLGLNLLGFLIGNGCVSFKTDAKVRTEFSYYHALLGRRTYEELLSRCCRNNVEDEHRRDICDLYWIDQVNNGVDVPKEKLHDLDFCNTTMYAAYSQKHFDPYNVYQQCYESTTEPMGSAASMLLHRQLKIDLDKTHHHQEQAARHLLAGNMVQSLQHTQRARINYASTDSNGGYLCYMSDKLEDYLNQPHVREALHIPTFVQPFKFCSGVGYHVDHEDVNAEFQSIIEHAYLDTDKFASNPFRMVLHNGDLDRVCSLTQTQYFTEDLARHYNVEGSKRETWRVVLPNDGLKPENRAIAGWKKIFKFRQNAQLDVVTVKGAGHFVPVDVPSSLQLLYNVVHGEQDISKPGRYSLTRTKLLARYQPPATHPARDDDTPSTTATTIEPPTGRTDQSSPPPVTIPFVHTTTPSGVGSLSPSDMFVAITMLLAKAIYAFYH